MKKILFVKIFSMTYILDNLNIARSKFANLKSCISKVSTYWSSNKSDPDILSTGDIKTQKTRNLNLSIIFKIVAFVLALLASYN